VQRTREIQERAAKIEEEMIKFKDIMQNWYSRLIKIFLTSLPSFL
jgi:hypothetical protein